eukprot:GILJ01011846.1.p1 GENE.GILJ01011846.1~~GILJ01011846.1.p1  ORF type:complete len:190 (+),score=36.56 GILJ01011846.1:50-571(+)
MNSNNFDQQRNQSEPALRAEQKMDSHNFDKKGHFDQKHALHDEKKLHDGKKLHDEKYAADIHPLEKVEPVLKVNTKQETLVNQRGEGIRDTEIAVEKLDDVHEHGTWSNVREHNTTKLYVDEKKGDHITHKDGHAGEVRPLHADRDFHASEARPLHADRTAERPILSSNPPAI